MTKIQIIIDDERSLQLLTCSGGLEIEYPELEYEEDQCHYKPATAPFCFRANNITRDNSPNLISLPDEVLLRIRNYNIDAEYIYEIETTKKLKQKNDSLQQSIGHHLMELNALEKEVARYHDVLRGMIDRYPMAAAEIALEDGNLECACYFANKANEEEEKDD